MFLYKYSKTDFSRSKNLNIVDSMKLRITLSNQRLAFHDLCIETGRHNNIDRSDRKCFTCNNNDIEDEYHFVLICFLYDSF